jgi:hypothetical protein
MRLCCRLVGPTGAPDVARQLMRLRLSAVWVLMVAFEGPVTVPGGMEGECKSHFFVSFGLSTLYCFDPGRLQFDMVKTACCLF